MAARGSVARRGRNPLRATLRGLDQRTRKTKRSAASSARQLRADIATVERTPGPAGQRGPAGPEGPEGPPGQGTTVHAGVVTTGGDGRATWPFPEPFSATPVVSATPVDPNPGDNVTFTVTIEQLTPDQVIVRVWQTRQILGLGLLPMTPAGSGIEVHMQAVSPS